MANAEIIINKLNFIKLGENEIGFDGFANLYEGNWEIQKLSITGINNKKSNYTICLPSLVAIKSNKL